MPESELLDRPRVSKDQSTEWKSARLDRRQQMLLEARPPERISKPEENRAPTSKKKQVIRAAAAVLLLVGGGIGYQYSAVWSHQETTENAYVRADITPVSAKVEGYVARLAVHDNQHVNAGDVLMFVESADYEAKVAKAEADLAAALANVGALEAAQRSTAAELTAQAGLVGQANANVTAARAVAARAASDRTRFEELAERGWTTKARLDQARAEAGATQAQVAAARAGQAASQGQSAAIAANSDRARSAIESGRAQVQAARAALRAAKLDLQRTVIRSPIDGTVGNRVVREGQLIRPGQQLLAIIPAEQSYVIANFKETQLAQMRVGQHAEIVLDAYPGTKLSGRIESLAPATGAQFALIPTDSATGNFTKIVQRVPIRISVQQSALSTQLLRPGLSAEAVVDTRS